nr:recombinase family protein [Actinomycetota bacterium]
MRTSIYSRISRDRTGAGLGVAAQSADCRALAESLGWEVVGTHDDNDLSAYSGKPRPGYAALLDDVRAGRIDAVLA